MKDVFSQMYFSDTLKIKVCRSGNYVYPVPMKSSLPDKEYLATLEYCKIGIVDEYMNHVYLKHVNDSVFEYTPDKSDHVISDINRWRNSISISLRRISRLVDLHKEPMEFYMQSDHYSLRLSLIDDRVEGNSFIVHMYLADDADKFIQMCMISIVTDKERTADGAAIMVYGSSTAYFMSPVRKTAEKIANGYKSATLNGLVGTYETYLIDCVLNKLYECIWNNDKQTIDYTYTPIEMWMFKMIMKDLGNETCTHRIFTWAHEEDLSKDLFLDDQELPEYAIINTDSFPLVDFSEKEWKFVDGFCKRNNLFEDAPTNILPYFAQPRYGKVYRMDVSTSDDKKVPLTITFKLNEEKRYLKMYIVETLDENTYVYATVDCSDIDQYTHENSVRRLSKHVLYTKLTAMRPTVRELIHDSSLLQSGIDNTSSLVGEILKLFAIMYHRPERSRMIKCVRHHETVKHTKHGIKREQKETIWRILKPTKEAKEYVSQMSSGSAHRQAEYTLEEWPRIGYSYTTKTGRVVWVPPTTCRRHEDLLNKDKEIKIKL